MMVDKAKICKKPSLQISITKEMEFVAKNPEQARSAAKRLTEFIMKTYL